MAEKEKPSTPSKTGDLSTTMSADVEKRARLLLEAMETGQQGGGMEFHRRYWRTLIK